MNNTSFVFVFFVLGLLSALVNGALFNKRDSQLFSKDKNNYQCGQNIYNNKFAGEKISKRIMGGVESRVGEWPWLVSLIFHMDNGTKLPVCGGTLIDRLWVVSAKHCFLPNPQFAVSTDPAIWTIRIGEHDMTNTDVPHVDVAPDAIILDNDHPLFKDDIAMIKLKHPVYLTKNRNVVCLPQEDTVFSEGMTCITAGWGHDKPGGVVSRVVNHVGVPIVNYEKCAKAYRDLHLEEFNYFDSKQLCAGHEGGGKDACQFDSGGPLMCKTNGQYTLAGIVSVGYDCGVANYPGVYTKITSYISWMRQVMTEN